MATIEEIMKVREQIKGTILSSTIWCYECADYEELKYDPYDGDCAGIEFLEADGWRDVEFEDGPSGWYCAECMKKLWPDFDDEEEEENS